VSAKRPAKKAAKKAAPQAPQAPQSPEKAPAASKYPSKRLIVPSALQGVENGKLPSKLLRPVKCGGQMYGPAAAAFNEMYDFAVTCGIKLRNVGDYRSYEQQLALFNQRYSTDDLGRKPTVTRDWQGQKYYLRPGMSPSSTPGKSNHGYGLAIDLDVTTQKVLDWLCKNAPTYGFYLQTSDTKSPEFEAWHWQYVG